MINPDLSRILQSATHWARGVSKEFDAHCIACMGSLKLTEAEGGALTLLGHTAEGDTISICLQDDQVWLQRNAAIAADGFAAIRQTDHRLTLPRYLRAQLAQMEQTA